MKLCAFRPSGRERERLGLGLAGGILDLGAVAGGGGRPLPATLAAALADWPRWEPVLRELAAAGPGSVPLLGAADVRFLPPLTAPPTFRDFYAFERHVRTARAGRGLEMAPEWYEMPVFYFSNPRAMIGAGQPVRAPRDCHRLDFELEIGAVIGSAGRDLDPATAEACIAGYCVLNDWSARDLQAREMKVGLGPAKGKDFATGLGPWLVTPDELAERRRGKGYDLFMAARRNGREISRGNWADLHWSFGEMLARASRDVTLLPGDVIGSGTVGTGCILELGPEAAGGWLRPGDRLELEIERLGVLDTPIEGPA